MTVTAPPYARTTSTLAFYQDALTTRFQLGNFTLPVLPEVASQVLAMSQNMDVHARKLSDLIHRDQALAAQVLRVANSAVYMRGRPVVSLVQAVIRLGAVTISEIAFGLTLQGEVFEAPGYEDEVRTLWRHAAASGVYGREMATALRENAEGQFLLGLLHTAGQALVLQAVAQIQQAANKPLLSGADVFQLMYTFEQEAAVLLFEQWDLPESITHVALHYRQPTAAAPPHRQNACITYGADRLATWLVRPKTIRLNDIIDDPVYRTIGFTRSGVNRLIERRSAILDVVHLLTTE